MQAFYGLVQNLTYFQNKWSMFVALAPPISLIGQDASPALNFLTNEATVSLIVNSHKMIGSYEFYPANWANSGTFKMLCALVYDVCLL